MTALAVLVLLLFAGAFWKWPKWRTVKIAMALFVALALAIAMVHPDGGDR